MFCPKCKNEYREGFTKCAECGVDLVESLDEVVSEEDLLFASNKSIEEQILSGDEGLLEEIADEETEEEIRSMYFREAAPTYVSPMDAAKDQLSSATVLLFVGLLGIIFLVLCAFGIINLPFGKMTMMILYIVMGGLFLIFAISGIFAYRSYKKTMAGARASMEEENRITEWCLLNINEKTVCVDDETASDEELYFKRTEIMRDMISKEFPIIDESYMEYIIDQIYTKVFDKE